MSRRATFSPNLHLVEQETLECLDSYEVPKSEKKNNNNKLDK